MKTEKIQNIISPAGPYSPWWPGINPPKQPDMFIIEIIGCIGDDWSEWFNGLQVQCDEKKGISYIHGKVKDQAELYSVLMKIRNLGLSLIRISGNIPV